MQWQEHPTLVASIDFVLIDSVHHGLVFLWAQCRPCNVESIPIVVLRIDPRTQYPQDAYQVSNKEDQMIVACLYIHIPNMRYHTIHPFIWWWSYPPVSAHLNSCRNVSFITSVFSLRSNIRNRYSLCRASDSFLMMEGHVSNRRRIIIIIIISHCMYVCVLTWAAYLCPSLLTQLFTSSTMISVST